jgi:PilZ domain
MAPTMAPTPQSRHRKNVMDNRREFARIVRQLDVDIASEEPMAGTTYDLSLKGLFVVCESKLAMGTAVDCIIYVDGRDGFVRIATLGNVIRSTSEGMAIEFNGLKGLESYEHLQRLLLLSAGNQVEQMEREFAEHIGLKAR